MKFFVFILISFVPAFCIVADLDKILDKSYDLRNKGVKGFVYQQAPLQDIYQAPSIEEIEPITPQSNHTGTYITVRDHYQDIRQIDEKLISLEKDLAKVSLILDNLQVNSESHSQTMNVITKTLELLIALVTLLAGGGLITLRKKKAASQ